MISVLLTTAAFNDNCKTKMTMIESFRTLIYYTKLTIILIFFCNILHSTQTAHSIGGLSMLVFVHAIAATVGYLEVFHCRFGVVCCLLLFFCAVEVEG